MTTTALGYAFLGGLLPSLIWLYFMLKEDSVCPEPKPLIALAFVAGMAAVPLALPAELFAASHLAGGVRLIAAWATIEEVLKYAMAAAFIIWRRPSEDTPDYVINMVTVALGFAAAENMLFLFSPLSAGNYATALFTGDLRFLGSTLVHIFSSSAIGFALAFSAKLRPPKRVVAAALGLILAIALHTAFNALIIKQGGESTVLAFSLVWAAAVVFFAAFEILKYFRSRTLNHL